MNFFGPTVTMKMLMMWQLDGIESRRPVGDAPAGWGRIIIFPHVALAKQPASKGFIQFRGL